jgi:hypothetical protein
MKLLMIVMALQLLGADCDAEYDKRQEGLRAARYEREYSLCKRVCPVGTEPALLPANGSLIVCSCLPKCVYAAVER